VSGRDWRVWWGVAVVALASAAILFASRLKLPALSADGRLDATFGNNGIVIQDFGSSDDFLNDIAIQEDGKIIGISRDTLVRFRQDGALDLTFGRGGVVSTFEKGRFHRVALQRDGKIVIAGAGSVACVIARYNADGSPDPSFGRNGLVTIGFGADRFDQAVAVAVRDDGKIVTEGVVVGLANTQRDFVTIRFASNGSLDASFNGTGIITQNINGLAVPSSLALQPDGKTVVGVSDAKGYALIRYDDDGSLDTSFNRTGIVLGNVPEPFGEPELVQGIAIQRDGAIVIAVGGSVTAFTIVRHRPDGSLDASFGTGGIKTSLEGSSSAIALQSDGRILVAGLLFTGGDGLALARFNTDGSEDMTFGYSGVAEARFAPAHIETVATPLHVQKDGRIVLGGTLGQASPQLPPFHDWVLTRFEGAAPGKQ
jgi:uncharacterized delta-60 repeat protein